MMILFLLIAVSIGIGAIMMLGGRGAHSSTVGYSNEDRFHLNESRLSAEGKRKDAYGG